jgi:hypothetical protein
VTADDAGLGSDFAAAGQPELRLEMGFFRGARRKEFHSLRDFDETFLALALFAARGRDFDFQ